MQDIFKRSMYGLAFFIMIVFFSGLYNSKTDKVPELPSGLAAVQCVPAPATERHAKGNRALLEYDTYAIYHLCIPLEMMNQKHMLKCSYAEDDYNKICDESAMLSQSFLHAGVNDVYATDRVTSKTTRAKSQVDISFTQTAFKKREPESKYYTKEDYIKTGISAAGKMRVRFQPVCEQPTTEREDTKCVVDVGYNTLYARMEISVLADSNGKVSLNNQVNEINFWLRFLNQLVIEHAG